MDMRHVMYSCFAFFFIPCVVLLDRSHFQQSQTPRKKSDRAKKQGKTASVYKAQDTCRREANL